jgi:hypothetical protein
MPGAYPASPPTLSGDLETINRLLQAPTYIKRRLRTFQELRFISDQILTGRYKSTGGAALYEQSEPILTDRAVQSVAAGSEYPYANLPTGTAAIAAVQKWGQAVFMSDEEIIRNVYAGDEVDRNLRKVVNTVIKQVDSVSLAAVAAAVTQTQAAAATWSTIATANPFLDAQLAVSQINALNLGYVADTILMNDTKYAYFTANNVVSNMLRREDQNNPIYTGKVPMLAGLKVVVSPNLPTSDVWVLDSTILGGMVDEADQAPGYSVDQMAIQVQSERKAKRDGWDMWGRRKTVPIVQEPGAAVRITGT